MVQVRPSPSLNRRPAPAGSANLSMSTLSRLFRLGLATLCLCACASQAPVASQSPLGVAAAFVSSLNHADLEALTSLFTVDATAFLPLDAAPAQLRGRAEIREAFRAFFQELRQQSEGPEYMHLVANDLRVKNLGRVAVVTFEAGSGPVASRRTLVMEYRAGAWLITHFHGSNIRQRRPEGGA